MGCALGDVRDENAAPHHGHLPLHALKVAVPTECNHVVVESPSNWLLLQPHKQTNASKARMRRILWPLSPPYVPCNRICLMQETNRRYMLWQDCQMNNQDELSVKTEALKRALGVQGERAGVVRIRGK